MLSLARTALDDPWAVPTWPVLSDGKLYDPDKKDSRMLYAIDCIDDAMSLLAPA